MNNTIPDANGLVGSWDGSVGNGTLLDGSGFENDGKFYGEASVSPCNTNINSTYLRNDYLFWSSQSPKDSYWNYLKNVLRVLRAQLQPTTELPASLAHQAPLPIPQDNQIVHYALLARIPLNLEPWIAQHVIHRRIIYRRDKRSVWHVHRVILRLSMPPSIVLTIVCLDTLLIHLVRWQLK